jgi:putative transposase
MAEPGRLTALSEAERAQALARFQLLQPYFEGQATLPAVAQAAGIPLRTAQCWATRYRQQGLAGLVRQPRADRGQRHLPLELQQLIEGLALQKTKPSVALIHRQVAALAPQQGWAVPSYDTVYEIVRALDPALVLLAQEGSKVYQQAYDLVHRRQANSANEIWQADHTQLDLYLLDERGQPARPWLTVIEDDYSRCIAGYFLTFSHPNALNTALALRQAIWRKADPRWRICGIPEIFYTDHGSDFTSQHMEQVCADLKSRLIFSTVGMPRGRGKIERFFQTVDQLLLCRLPGYVPGGGSAQGAATPPALTLADLDAIFLEFLLSEYQVRPQRDLTSTPQARWEAVGFLPHMPESLEQLDLLLLTVAKARRVRRDGIHFHNLRYLDPVLAAYVGEDVVIRYDPRDMAEIRVYHHNTFLCRAVCQELAGQTLSLKEIIRARNQRRRELKQEIKDRAELIQIYLQARQGEPALPLPAPTNQAPAPPPARRLKLYENE